MKRMCLCFDFKGQEPSRRESCESESRVGPLTGGPQCRMSNLRNPHVPCKGLVINYGEGGGAATKWENRRSETFLKTG